jgi:cephalosporin-C deacetylase-like acetyl esterase
MASVPALVAGAVVPPQGMVSKLCGSAEHDYVGSQCWPLGDSIARYFLHDAIRGIDYLCTRPEVDPERIGVTGNSGGGAQTCMLMLYDQRIAAAAPATFLTDMNAYMRTGIPQDAEQIWPGFVGAGLGHEDILLSMVPRPVLVLGAKYDYFPIEGTRKSIKRAKRFWKMYDKENCLELFEDESDHDYTEKMALKAAEFFSEHLLGRQIMPSGVMAKPLESSVLLCTKTGQVNGDMIGARNVFDENCERTIDLHRLRKKLNEKQQKDIAINWLKNKIYNNRKMCDLNPRIFFIEQVNELLVWDCLWWTQEGLFNHGILIKNSHFTAEEMPVTIAVWEGGTRQLKSQMKWIGKECEQARAVLVLDVSGVGYIAPNPINSYYHESDFGGAIAKLAYDLFWMDDSMAAMRTFDVIRAIDTVSYLHGLKTEDLCVYGYGQYGIYAQLAAVLDERIKGVNTEHCLESLEKLVCSEYYDSTDIMSILLPGMLKYFDLPDILCWTASDLKEEENAG